MSENRWAVPASWEWAGAGEIAAIVGGGTPPASDAANFADEGMPWLTPADLTDFKGVYIERGRRSLSAKGLASCGATPLPPGTVLYSSRAPIGYCVIGSNEITTNQGFKSLVLQADVSPEYVRHYLLASKPYAEGLASGTTFLELSGSRMSELAIPLPPLAEQRRIVAKLDALLARTANARAELDRVPTLAARYKQALLAAAFRGELTRDLQCDHSGAATGGDLPVSWKRSTVEELASSAPRSIQSGPFGSNLLHSEFQAEGVLVVGIDNVQDGSFSLGAQHRISNRKYKQLEKYAARPLDVIITVMATVGRTCVVPSDIETAIITKHLYRIAVDGNKVDPFYLMNALRGAEDVLEQLGVNLRGQTRPGINGGILKRLVVPLPPLMEQRKIVRRLNSRFAEIDRLTAEATSARRLLDRLDQSILAKAFRGALVPQDPADEPASVLLDRIRTERAAAPAARRGGRPSRAA